ncbi:TetR/AcrR family transcriptional regulator [Stutzerimonas nitrititolerans]|uniref:TetR/AcrR family transcriptional regulator n=1 Tax=Stutzerimonas nitrititolerans TaxID=2482751 RepID=UPI0015E3F2A4|nr:TetR/AcrR family transcriptional regulator [Stutzerimonas nitrititolerans]MBA1184662.1 TetR/AcrR family transcriptional regulator [Stutzerimonas stutzeri]
MRVQPVTRFESSRERALELFADQGFGQVSLRQLASHMGVSTGTLYTHVAGKEELLFEALEEHYEQLLILVGRCARPGPTIQPTQRLSRMVGMAYRQCPSRFLLACRERHCLRPGHRTRIDSLRRRIADGLRTSLVGDEVDELAGEILLNLIEHLPVWLAGQGLPAGEQTSMIETLLQGCLQGLRHQPQQ